jgi:hypothetical protein
MKPAVVILAIVLTAAQLTVADDFKTIDGKEYKNVTVSRVESDGIVLKSKSGISKVYFVELPKEVQERFHYDLGKTAQSRAAEASNSSNHRRPLQLRHLAMSSLRKLRVSGPNTNGKSKQPLQPGSPQTGRAA